MGQEASLFLPPVPSDINHSCPALPLAEENKLASKYRRVRLQYSTTNLRTLASFGKVIRSERQLGPREGVS